MFKGGMAGMMQKAKQMQEDMETAQKEIKSLTCEGLSAAGALKVEMNGDHQVTNIVLDETLMSDKEMLEDLIMMAVNDASSKISTISKEKMKNVEDLTVVSPGTQKRNFTHIDDTIDALILIGEDGYGDEYGIGDPKGYTVLEVAQIYGGKIDIQPERKGNRITANVVSEKTKALGWKPFRTLEAYINDSRISNWI